MLITPRVATEVLKMGRQNREVSKTGKRILYFPTFGLHKKAPREDGAFLSKTSAFFQVSKGATDDLMFGKV
jgi:hypothetical protein